MHIWMVLYVMGRSGAIFGPLPYDISECELHQQQQEHTLDGAFAAAKLPKDATIKRTDIAWRCLERQTKPEVGEILGEVAE